MNSIIDKISEQTRMIQQINAITYDSKWLKPRSMDELSIILKCKTKDKDITRQHQLTKGKQWLSNKGINLAPLITRVTHEKQKQTREWSEPTANDGYFHVTLNKSTVKEYLQKSDEYATMNLMHYTMDRRNTRPRFTQKYLEKQLRQGPTVFTNWSGENSKEKRSKYIQLIKDVVEKKLDHHVQCIQLLKEFRSSMIQLGDDFFWEILTYQLTTFKREMTKEENIARMFVTSYKLIQKDVQKKVHNQDIQRYLARQYVGKVEGKWAFQHGGFWARVWLNYCMGMKDQVSSLLLGGNRDFKELNKLYIATEDALTRGKPIKEHYVSRYDIDDIFYEQFIYNITGQARYSSQFMAEKLGLELILTVVRTVGIYYETEKGQLERLRTRLMRNYKDYCSDPQIMKNILYLLDYDEIIKMGANSIMTNDDYLHFLIVLTGFPQLVSRQLLYSTLSTLLVKYIMELMSEGKKQYIYYLTFFREKDLIRDVSSMILAVDALDKFNWKESRELLGQELYFELASATIEKYRLRTRNNLKAAKKTRELLEDDQKALNYLLEMVVNHYLCRYKYQKEQVSEAINLGSEISKEETGPRVYAHSFEFIKAYRQMTAHLATKNDKALYSFISNCDFIIVQGGRGHPLGIDMLELLCQVKGMDLYYDFLLKLLRGAEVCAGRLGQEERLRWIRQLISQTIGVIEGNDNLNGQLKSQYLYELREELNEQLF